MILSVKVIASVAVILGGGYIGILMSSRLSVRLVQIEEIDIAVTQLGFNISFLKMSVANAVLSVGKSRGGTIGEILKTASSEMEKTGVTPDIAFKRSLELHRGLLCITEDDRNILNEFAINLGKGDIESEMNNINAARAKLKIAEGEARGEKEKKGKLWQGAGLLCGILVVVLLF